MVNNVAHIWFIDPHSESYRGTNKLDFAFAPFVMAKRTIVWFQSCMVKRDLAGFSRVLKPQGFYQLPCCLFAIFFGKTDRANGVHKLVHNISVYVLILFVFKRTNR